MIMNSVIRLKDVRKSFGNVEVLKKVDLSIPPGKITTIMGLSGSGKSVTMKLILGLLEPDEGSIYFYDEEISHISFSERKHILKKLGVVFQNAALFDSLTLFENVAFPLREHTDFNESQIEEKVNHILELVGLAGAGNKFPSELSGGMRKRGGLARALVMEPEVMLYDEPTTGLDPVTGRMIEDLIIELQRKYNHTCLIINHDVSSILRMSDYVAFLYGGIIRFFGTPEELEKSEDPFITQFLKGESSGPIKVA